MSCQYLQGYSGTTVYKGGLKFYSRDQETKQPLIRANLWLSLCMCLFIMIIIFSEHEQYLYNAMVGKPFNTHTHRFFYAVTIAMAVGSRLRLGDRGG